MENISITLLQLLVNATGAEFEDQELAIEIITETLNKVSEESIVKYCYWVNDVYSSKLINEFDLLNAEREHREFIEKNK